MFKYKYLHKIFNTEDTSTYEKAKNDRLSSFGAIWLDFKMKPYKFSGEFQLFFYNHPDMMKKAETIMSDSEEIKKIARELPGIAKESYQINTLVEEMQGTNEIEGVRSSKAEMNEGLRKIIKDGAEPIRHKGLIKSYLNLQKTKMDLLTAPKDIREIYDYLVYEEIKERDKPDGLLFRTDPSELAGSTSGKMIHVSTLSEQSIEAELEKLITFLNSDMLPQLHKVAIGHFIFGYIHPFYDGNGRTSRYISSIYLRQILGPITALSLSKACKDNLRVYLDAFANTNSFKSAGDVTFFIDSFFDILIDEQKVIIADLKEKKAQLAHIEETLTGNDELDIKEKAMLYLLFQEYVYGEFSEGLTKKEIIQFSNKKIATDYYFNKVKDSLLAKKAIKIIKQKPMELTIEAAYFGMAN
ncbi:Fic family protein [Listeria booriae]|uniref:Fic family protein n=1 Tax=Listeria booriae TaxID=1552123 RepID=A0A7X1CZI4_9LIST|nr:Fic family protein [Listeria booriae]MBC2117488.1 Fic family protein [Listeria booriae]